MDRDWNDDETSFLLDVMKDYRELKTSALKPELKQRQQLEYTTTTTTTGKEKMEKDEKRMSKTKDFNRANFVLDCSNLTPITEEDLTSEVNSTVEIKNHEEIMYCRTSPISARERELLLSLICKEDVLKSKRIDGKIVMQKREAWARITKIFNAHNLGPKRSGKQMKKIWERLKIKAKRDHADIKRECRKTGGGQPPPSLDSTTQKILTIIGSEVDDIGCDFDSDTMRVIPMVNPMEEGQDAGDAVPTINNVNTLEAPQSENVPADPPNYFGTTSETILSDSKEEDEMGAVQSRPHSNAQDSSLTPTPPSQGSMRAAITKRRRRFETSLPALRDGALWRKEAFGKQKELVELQKNTEKLRQELLRAQLEEAQTRGRIALLEEEILRNKLGK